eukprot:2551592-Rhodomonas_salina.2
MMCRRRRGGSLTVRLSLRVGVPRAGQCRGNAQLRLRLQLQVAPQGLPGPAADRRDAAGNGWAHNQVLLAEVGVLFVHKDPFSPVDTCCSISNPSRSAPPRQASRARRRDLLCGKQVGRLHTGGYLARYPDPLDPTPQPGQYLAWRPGYLAGSAGYIKGPLAT